MYIITMESRGKIARGAKNVLVIINNRCYIQILNMTGIIGCTYVRHVESSSHQ